LCRVFRCFHYMGADTDGLRRQNRAMNDKMHFRRGAMTFDLSALADGESALQAAKRYTSTGVAAEFAALQAAMRPVEAFRKQLQVLDTARSIRTTMEQHELADMRMRAAESSALEEFRRHAEMSSAEARFAALDFDILARTKAIEEMLSPSKMVAKYLEELTGSRALKLAAEQAPKWGDSYKELAGALERFKEPLGISSARALLESMAKASKPFGVRRLLDEAAQLPESEAAREEVVHLVRGVTDGVSSALTLQDAVGLIVQAIQATKEPLYQRLLCIVLVPILIATLFAFVNSVVDFHTKKWLEGAPKQDATKQVKQAAREAVGDVRVLNDFRFVSVQSLAMMSGSKARAPVVGRLRFGQTVRVLERERDFTLVVWRSEDGKVELQGWVFSRYLKRFT